VNDKLIHSFKNQFLSKSANFTKVKLATLTLTLTHTHTHDMWNKLIFRRSLQTSISRSHLTVTMTSRNSLLVKSRSSPPVPVAPIAPTKIMERTLPCNFGISCNKRDKCGFYHTVEEKGSFVTIDCSAQMYTKVCTNYLDCKKGVKCTFAHSLEQLVVPLCKRRGCDMENCRFLHPHSRSSDLERSYIFNLYVSELFFLTEKLSFERKEETKRMCSVITAQTFSETERIRKIFEEEEKSDMEEEREESRAYLLHDVVGSEPNRWLSSERDNQFRQISLEFNRLCL